MAPHARVPIRLRHSRNTRSATAPCTPCPRSDLHHARQLQQSALRTTAGSVGSWMWAHRICGPVTEPDASCSALRRVAAAPGLGLARRGTRATPERLRRLKAVCG